MCRKKDFITKKGDRKQKRVMLDTLLNLHKRFVEKTHIKISCPMFCKLRPFWVIQPRCDGRNTCMCVIHSNIDLMLKLLYNAKIISVSNYVDLQTKFAATDSTKNVYHASARRVYTKVYITKNSITLFHYFTASGKVYAKISWI